jgi:hypothetical protein
MRTAGRNSVVVGARHDNEQSYENKSDSLADAQKSHDPIPDRLYVAA